MRFLNSFAISFLSTISISVSSAVERLSVSIFTLHVDIILSNIFCSIFIFAIFFIPKVFIFLFRLCFNLVLKIDIFIYLGYNIDILMFRRL